MATSRFAFSSAWSKFGCLFCRPNNPFNKTQIRFVSSRKNRKNENIIVQLLQDVPRFGPEGTFIPVARGHMRNALYPSKHARYVIGQELKSLITSGLKIERHTEFLAPVAPLQNPDFLSPDDMLRGLIPAGPTRVDGFQDTSEAAQKDLAVEEVAQPIKLPSITPERAVTLLESLVPPTLVIHRQVNLAAAATAASAEAEEVGLTPIFGSVTAFDIILELKKYTSANDEAATIMLEESMITIDGHVNAQIKQLGSSSITIILGDGIAVEKTLTVRNIPSAVVGNRT